MKSFIELKKRMIDKNISFTVLARKDGRSRQYLYRECKIGNQKVLDDLYKILSIL
nr:MAG TPA: repressor protein C2 [Caudoviricetes sp.]